MATTVVKHLLVLMAAALACTAAAQQRDRPVQAPCAELHGVPLSQANRPLYAAIVGDARLYGGEHVGIEQGYVVESGTYRRNSGGLGSIVMVRSVQGQVTAIVDLPGRYGIFVGGKGRTSQFTPTRHEAMGDQKDTVPGDTPQPGHASHAVSEASTIEVFTAYSTYALKQLNVDPVAYALAQMETVNQPLRNSKVEGVLMRLAAVNVFNVDGSYDTTSGGLSKWQTLMDRYRSIYKADLNMAISGTGNSDVAGRAYIPGYTSVNGWYSATVFRHEVGHNAGGDHCNTGQDDYKFGYGKTILCGNVIPYYSTPDVTDEDGQPLGDKNKADMARLWREQAARMADYNPELPGERLLFVTGNRPHSATLELATRSDISEAGVVALSPEVGPTTLERDPPGDDSTLHIQLTDLDGQTHTVVLRATRSIDGCRSGPMNRSAGCATNTPLRFTLSYEPTDNPDLPAGTYNGMVTLEARDVSYADYIVPIHAIISIDTISAAAGAP